MIVEVKGNVYRGSKHFMETTILRMAHDAVRNTNCIFCIEKDERMTMMNEPHQTAGSMLESVEKYEAEGFKVYYSTKEESA